MTVISPGERDPARFNSAIRQLYAGGSNNTGKVTLRAGQTTTVVNHESVNPNSHISIMPLTANALAAMVSAAAPKLYTVTRVLSAASGNVSYTGLGFKPSLIQWIGGVVAAGAGYLTFNGFDDGTTHFCGETLSGATGAPTGVQNAYSLLMGDNTAGTNQFATVASMDADGFTLTWTKNGSPTATATAVALCLPAAVGVRVSSRTTGSFTLTHPSNAAADQNFTFEVTGGA